jgi:hypothetical protein
LAILHEEILPFFPFRIHAVECGLTRWFVKFKLLETMSTSKLGELVIRNFFKIIDRISEPSDIQQDRAF